MLLAGAAVSLVCITVHELSHGLIAYRLGDPTARINGRLTLNPLAHIDPVGLLMMLTVRVGWAKPVPVDMRNFQRPKRDRPPTSCWRCWPWASARCCFTLSRMGR